MEIAFAGKRTLVTGATKGIGKEIAIGLSKAGADVIAVGRSQNLLDLLKLERPEIKTVKADLADWNKTNEALSNIGCVDLLVNNAGLGWLKPMSEITEEDVDSSYQCNKLIARQASGAIVNLSSQASMAGLMHHSVYCASKGAVDAFTRAAALELGPQNIRINCVNPTVIMTDMGRLGWSDPKMSQPMLQKIPLRRFGEVHKVVDAVLFLLSDKSSMITGSCLPIDGGFLAC